MHKYWKVALVVLAVAGLAAGILRCYDPAAAVQDGTPEDFWYAATKIHLTEGRVPDARIEALYEVKDGSFLYYRNAAGEQLVFRVPVAEVQRTLAAAVQRIQAEAPRGELSWVGEGLRVWTDSDPDRDNAAELILCTGRKRAQRMEKEQEGQLRLTRVREAAARDRWSRFQWYPWIAAGEFAYLAGLLLFAAWPFLRNAGPVSWAVHLGLVPILFFLPFWLGYGSQTFTPVSLKGGVLYPALLAPFGFLPWTGLDSSIGSLVPQVLESVTPVDVTAKVQKVLRGGPTIVFALGLVTGVTTYGLRNMRRLRLRAIRRRRRRERKEERLRVEQQAREWAARRADVLAEVRQLLEGEILPRLEQRLREEVLQLLDQSLANGELADGLAAVDEHVAETAASAERAVHSLQYVGDFPLPFGSALPAGRRDEAAAVNNVAPPAAPPEGDGPSGNGVSGPES